jgi:isoquinoline 1-oxidoreductase alpha subunit
MQVAALLSQRPALNADQIITKMDDVICRCGTYPRIKKGIKTAIQMSKKEVKKS